MCQGLVRRCQTPRRDRTMGRDGMCASLGSGVFFVRLPDVAAHQRDAMVRSSV